MRALLSVYDKTGIIDLAKGLHELGWDLVGSGGTARDVRDAGIPITETVEITGVPAILGHRVVTLHPKIHGGILADRNNPHHVSEMADYGIEPFDLVVGNLYPFGSQDFSHGQEPEDAIDIGGPAMIRAAAKNHAHVGVLCNPDHYFEILAELKMKGELSADIRRRLSRVAFAHTAAYDAAVVAWFDEADDPILPPTLHIAATRDERTLRYGENPHQRAGLYVNQGENPWWLAENHVQHGDFANSYLNLYDADAAWRLVHLLEGESRVPAVAIIKHANACGAAVANTLAEAYQRAYEGDERSAFGGIVALNYLVDHDTADVIVAAAQADVIIAPGYMDGVLDKLIAKRKNTRLLETTVRPSPLLRHLRPITGGWLAQEPHGLRKHPTEWEVVTERQPTMPEMMDAHLAFLVCAATTSNAIVLVKDGVAWGIGAGQQNRVEAGLIAKDKANGRAEGGACASDAFYPFPDGIEAAAAAGVAVIVQPGGSRNDQKCIDKANELGVAMVFTGERQFKH